MYEIFELLMLEHGVTAYKVAKETGITQSTLSDWKRGRSTPKSDNMKKISDYFGVSLDYLMTGKNKHPTDYMISNDGEQILIETANRNPKDEQDIKREISRILQKLSNKENGPINYGGEVLSDVAVELLGENLEMFMRRLKKESNEKHKK